MIGEARTVFRPGFARVALQAALLAACCAGCGVQYPDRELAKDRLSNPGFGYRADRLPSLAHPKEGQTLVLVAFSGGGTRAAAFSYGVLCALSETTVTVQGKKGSMLDQVDVISSTSGGSFTSAYYGLFKGEIFRDFRDRFLYRNIQADLAAGLFWPPEDAFRIFNPWSDFSRIDMAAALYDRLLFKGKTFEDFPLEEAGLRDRNPDQDGDRRPFIILNSTNLGMESPFEFTQDQFDLLGSDLDSYPVARAVAASSAFPPLLSPLTLENFDVSLPKPKPEWVTKFQDDWTYKQGGAYLNEAADWNSYQDKKGHPWIHLQDGGLTDNLALRALTRLFYDPGDPDSGWRKREVRRIILISVDSSTDSDSGLDRSRKAPGPLRSMLSTIAVLMDSYTSQSTDEVVDLKHSMDALHIPVSLVVITPHSITDTAQREMMMALPTSFHLTRGQVDMDMGWGKALLLGNRVFQDAVDCLDHPDKEKCRP